MTSTLLTIIFTAIIGGLGWLLRSESEKRREVEKQLSEKKYSVYISIIQLFFEAISSGIFKKELKKEELSERIVDIIKELVIYGSDNVLKVFSEWKQYAMHGSDDGSYTIIQFSNLVIAIRKDMGHPYTKINMDDILGMFITDYPDFKQKLYELVESRNLKKQMQ